MSSLDQLYPLAEPQGGYFTAAQAALAGVNRQLLSYHSRPGGGLIRIRPGLYRILRFPAAPHEATMAAWLSVGAGVVSHESALAILELSDVIPDEVHLTVSRSLRGRRRRPGVRLHTPAAQLPRSQVWKRAGLPVTSAARSIVDAASTGAAPEQIELAVRQALARGLTTPAELRRLARGRSARVRRLVAAALGTP